MSIERRIRDGSELFLPPDGIVRNTLKYWIVIGTGPAAILEQLSHPLVASGVAHSTFESDPIGRLYRTLDGYLGVVFETVDGAREKARRVNQTHIPVRGELSESAGIHEQGATYFAQDSNLSLWVAATLIKAGVEGYTMLVGDLDEREKNEFVRQSAAIYPLFGVPEDMIPDSWEGLMRYMDDMIGREKVVVTPRAKETAQAVLRYPLPEWTKKWKNGSLENFWNATVPVITPGFLHPKIREQFGFDWGDEERGRFSEACGHIKTWAQELPEPLQYVPWYYGDFYRASCMYVGTIPSLIYRRLSESGRS